MKHIFSFIIIATLLMFSMTSCTIRVTPSDDNVVEKIYDLKDFNAVYILSYADVIYVPGNNYSVKVTAAESDIDNLSLSLHGNHLVIEAKQNGMGIVSDAEDVDHETWHFSTGLHEMKPVTIYVTCPKVVLVDLEDSGSFTCKNEMHTDDLSFYVAGSGNINLGRTFAQNVKVQIAGSGDVKIDWLSAKEAGYTIVGSGSINSKEYHTLKSQVDISGSGDISVDYTDCKHADALITGSGNVYMSGSLESLSENSTGSGDIHRENLKTKYAPQTNEEE